MSATDFRARLEALAADDLLRTRLVLDAPCGPEAVVAGRRLISFAGNDYLGLANHPEIVDAFRAGAASWGVGAGASHLVSGHQRPHDELEAALARFTGLPRALYFSTGYMANLAVLPALAGRGDTVIADRLNHASLVDAALLSRATVRRYPHGDVAAAARMLEAAGGRKVVVTDGVFSMDGDIAPLPELLDLCERHDALLVVDDAHGFGVLGEDGLGALQLLGLRSPRLVLMGTLGKAAGLAGAFVVAHDRVIEFLLQSARNYIFSTAAPPLLEHAVLTSLRLIQGPEGRRRRAALRERVAQWRAGAQALLARHAGLGWRLIDSQTPVQTLVVGGNAPAMALSARLEAEGLRVPGIRPPTVPVGSARLRVTLCASHAPEDVDQLLHALERAALSVALEVA